MLNLKPEDSPDARVLVWILISVVLDPGKKSPRTGVRGMPTKFNNAWLIHERGSDDQNPPIDLYTDIEESWST